MKMPEKTEDIEKGIKRINYYINEFHKAGRKNQLRKMAAINREMEMFNEKGFVIRKRLFTIVLFRDKTLHVPWVEKLHGGFVFIAPGRTLTISGIDRSTRFEFHMHPKSIVKGNIRVARTPLEVSQVDLHKTIDEIVKQGPSEEEVEIASNNEEKS